MPVGRPKVYVDFSRAEWRFSHFLCVCCGRLREENRRLVQRCQRCQDRDTERKRAIRAAIKAEAQFVGGGR